jgi:transposase
MKQKSGPDKAPAEQVLKNIRRQTRRQYSAEDADSDEVARV